jgi:hypothetical protein
MKKIRLDPDALNVHSFTTVGGPAHGSGTIRGHWEDPPFTWDPTCGCDRTPVTFCTQGGSCMDGPCKADSSPSQCLC